MIAFYKIKINFCLIIKVIIKATTKVSKLLTKVGLNVAIILIKTGKNNS